MVKKNISYYIFIFFLFLWVIPVNAQTITKGPFLAELHHTSLIIRWESDIEADFKIEYGLKRFDTKPARMVGKNENGFFYETVITGLKPGEKYHYKIISESIQSDLHYFKTESKETKPFSFIVLGDSRSNPSIFNSISRQINNINPAIILANGDLVAEGGNYQQWQNQFFDATRGLIDHIPFISAVGDHEADDIDGDKARLFTYYFLPQKNNLKLWYSYDYGNSHFVFLDWRYPYNKEMIEWFKSDVGNSDKKWKFVIMHRPSYNLGGHRSAWGKEIWPDLFETYKIDVVFSGHSHLYERFFPTTNMKDSDNHPVTYITTGGAGASLYESDTNPTLAFSKSIHHFLHVKINKNNIEIKAIDVNNDYLDSVSWSKINGKVDAQYFASVIPREMLDLINVFNGPISTRMAKLPMVKVPYEPVLDLNPANIDEDINFTIQLSKESQLNYNMQPVSGIIKTGLTLHVPLKIFGKTTLTVTKWGEVTPPLRLIVLYKTPSFKGTLKGGKLEYIAW